jgi:hypothetical protein
MEKRWINKNSSLLTKTCVDRRHARVPIAVARGYNVETNGPGRTAGTAMLAPRVFLFPARQS